MPTSSIPSTTSHIQINAQVSEQHKNKHTLNLQPMDCQADNTQCCGGYCGSMLWKKLLLKPKTSTDKNQQQVIIYSKKHFPIGSTLSLSLSQTNILKIQLFLWLLPTLVLLLLLYLLPSQWGSLCIAFASTTLIWLTANHFTKKKTFGLQIKQKL
jgi:positive regulator of sigma E activity